MPLAAIWATFRIEHHSPHDFATLVKRWPNPRIVFEASMNCLRAEGSAVWLRLEYAAHRGKAVALALRRDGASCLAKQRGSVRMAAVLRTKQRQQRSGWLCLLDRALECPSGLSSHPKHAHEHHGSPAQAGCAQRGRWRSCMAVSGRAGSISEREGMAACSCRVDRGQLGRHPRPKRSEHGRSRARW